MNYNRWIMLFFFGLGMFSVSALTLASEKALIFGIVPQESASKLADQWTPVMLHLSERLERPVRFATAKDIPTFEQRVLAGQYDIAYMNPYHYVEFSQAPGYRAVARESGKQIQGLVVVGESHPAQTLKDLEGVTIAFPAPAAFAATILVRAELETLGVSYTPRFVSSHESVYLNVSRNFAAAGGGIERTFSSAVGDGLKGLRVIWRSKKYTPHAFAVHPDLREGEVSAIQAALANLGNDEAGRQLLDQANLKSLIPALDSDWNDIRKLGLDFMRLKNKP